MKLKIDIHMHTSLDPVDGIDGGGIVIYSPKEAFVAAAKFDIEVLAITHHESIICTPQMHHEAAQSKIRLIPALEATIEGKHVIILNPVRRSFKTFDDLAAERAKNPYCFIMAAHPFYPGESCLHEKLAEYVELFDAIEYCHFYLSWFNIWNKKAVSFAESHKKSIIATSDAHTLDAIGLSYSIVEVKSRRIEDIIDALKRPERVTMVTSPPPFKYVVRVLANIARTFRFFKR